MSMSVNDSYVEELLNFQNRIDEVVREMEPQYPFLKRDRISTQSKNKGADRLALDAIRELRKGLMDSPG